MSSPLRPDQIQHILKLFKIYLRKGRSQAQACEEIGRLYERSSATIHTLVERLLSDTTNVAQSYLKSNALKLAMSVVRDASVAQKIDILERPNIAVLAPKKASGDGQRGFFLTVSADSCGGVKASVGVIEGATPELPAVQSDEEKVWEASQAKLLEGTTQEPPVIEGQVEGETLDSLGRPSYAKTHPEFMKQIAGLPKGPGKSPSYLAAVERARKRLEDAKL